MKIKKLKKWKKYYSKKKKSQNYHGLQVSNLLKHFSFEKIKKNTRLQLPMSAKSDT